MLKIGTEIVCFALFTIETMMNYFFGEHSEVSAGSCCFALGWVSCSEWGAGTGEVEIKRLRLRSRSIHAGSTIGLL